VVGCSGSGAVGRYQRDGVEGTFNAQHVGKYDSTGASNTLVASEHNSSCTADALAEYDGTRAADTVGEYDGTGASHTLEVTAR
jgi:hypothetical protein